MEWLKWIQAVYVKFQGAIDPIYRFGVAIEKKDYDEAENAAIEVMRVLGWGDLGTAIDTAFDAARAKNWLQLAAAIPALIAEVSKLFDKQESSDPQIVARSFDDVEAHLAALCKSLKDGGQQTTGVTGVNYADIIKILEAIISILAFLQRRKAPGG